MIVFRYVSPPAKRTNNDEIDFKTPLKRNITHSKQKTADSLQDSGSPAFQNMHVLNPTLKPHFSRNDHGGMAVQARETSRKVKITFTHNARTIDNSLQIEINELKEILETLCIEHSQLKDEKQKMTEFYCQTLFQINKAFSLVSEKANARKAELDETKQVFESLIEEAD